MYLIILLSVILALLIISELLPEKESLAREKLRLDKQAYLRQRMKNGHRFIN